MKLFPKFLLAVLFCLLAATTSHAQLNKYVVQCQQGGGVAVVSGVSSSSRHPVSYTSSAIRIYQAGTTTDATLYSDASGITPLANPNTCNSVAQFTFYTSEISIDWRLSPTGVTPFTTSGVGPNVIGYASTTRAGITKLSVAPASSTNPIAVGKNDFASPSNAGLVTTTTTTSTAVSSDDYSVNDCIRPYKTLGVTGAGTSASPFAGWESTAWNNKAVYCFGGFHYTYATAPNWAKSGIKLFFEGATFHHTGAGVAAKFEDSIGLTEGITATNALFIGNASTTDGLSIKSIHKSLFWNLRFAAIPASVLHTQFAITDTFKVQYSLDEDVNVDGLAGTIHPQYGYYLESLGGNPTQDCTFIAPIIEGVTVAGIFLNSANVNRFSGGTVEANTGVGVRLFGASRGNHFSDMDLECNNDNLTTGVCAQGQDIRVDAGALGNTFDSIESLGSTNIEGDATTLSGQFGDLTLAATADSPYLFNIRVTGTYVNNSTSVYIVGQSSPLQYTIGGQVLKSVSATTLRTQPTAAGQLSIINTPSGNNGAILSVDQTDRVADGTNIAGVGLAANVGAAIRLYSVGVGSATRQNIEISADQATPNSASTQLKLLTGGVTQVNLLAQTEGAVLSVSSNTITPTASVHHVGAGLIKTITVPSGFVSGTISLIPDSAFTYDTTGNIAAGGGGTATIGRVMTFTYSSSSSKWYASY